MKGRPDTIDIIEQKRLQWYGHVKRMPGERIPKLIMEWIPRERRKRGHPRKTCIEGVQAAVTTRNLRSEQRRNGEEWRLVSGRRRQLFKKTGQIDWLGRTGRGTVCQCLNCLASMDGSIRSCVATDSLWRTNQYTNRTVYIVRSNLWSSIGTAARWVISVVVTCKGVFRKSFKCFAAWNCLPVHGLLCKQCLYS